MKEKCHFIDHEISLNLEKLDSLLSLVKSKKQQFESLNGIVEALIEDEIDSLKKEKEQTTARIRNADLEQNKIKKQIEQIKEQTSDSDYY